VAEAGAGASRNEKPRWVMGTFCFLSGLKLSGERDGGLGLARPASAVSPFSVGRPAYVRKMANGLLCSMARRYGRCCMYGPHSAKLSRVFAVLLFA
jgi:hypothetical protein